MLCVLAMICFFSVYYVALHILKKSCLTLKFCVIERDATCLRLNHGHYNQNHEYAAYSCPYHICCFWQREGVLGVWTLIFVLSMQSRLNVFVTS